MPTSPAIDIAVVRQRWNRFCQSGDPGYLDELPRALSESWQRSLAEGVDPGLRQFPQPDGQPRWDDDEALLITLADAAVAPCMGELLDSDILLAIISNAGRIVYRAGSTETLHEADIIGSVPGAVTLESAAGTNSAGTALYSHNVTTVTHWQHFCEAFWSWSDVGVPIVHPRTNKLLGMVDLALPRGLVSPALALTAKAVAGNFQREIMQRESRMDDQVIQSWCRRVADTALLATDRYGNVLCISERAKQILQRPTVTREALGDILNLPALFEGRLRDSRVVDANIREREFKVHVEPTFVDNEAVGMLLRFERSGMTIVKPWAARYSFGELVGGSAAFKQVLARAKRLAATDLSILLVGETGTGKELMAHAIHAESARAAGPFVTINCGAVPEDLIASELFGYEKGAFTGANRDGQRGKFELAHGGTLFLDEITETSHVFQVSLLRVIQDGNVVPVGADQGRPIDVRIISATNRVPAEAIAAGALRRDLYYRLNGAMLTLPPLRERRDDIPALVARYCREAGRECDVAPDALAMLMAYDWPGNLRELHAVIRTAATLALNGRIERADLPAEWDSNDGSARGAQVRSHQLRQAEHTAIERAMTEARGNVKQAAVLLGIGRSSLYRKLKRMELNREWVWR